MPRLRQLPIHRGPAAVLAAAAALLLTAAAQAPLYKDPKAPTAERVRDLLSRMTLAEKIGQMTQVTLNAVSTGEDVVELDAGKARDWIRRYQIGSFLNGVAAPPEQWLRVTDTLQRLTLEESRLGIPMIYGIDHVHGSSYLAGGTIFPQPLNIAASFDDAHAAAMGRVTVVETAALGHHWIFAPILDVARHPAWPRVYETFGEDPLLAGRMGAAFTRAIQDPQAAAPHRATACAKHFLGYPVPVSGWDRTPAEISDQALQEFLRPSFQAAVDAGIHTVMINSGEINGVPVHASRAILTDLLRRQMGFRGVALTDWEDIIKLATVHRVARDEKEAVRLAIEAGVDMSMTPLTVSFCGHLEQLVREGAVSEARIDESVRRILALKLELGLFEHPFPSRASLAAIGAPAHRRAALDAARDSLVLLRNEGGLLPLPAGAASLLVAGPSARSKRNLAGGWTLRWQGGRPEEYPEAMPTLFEAVKAEFPRSRVTVMEDLGEAGTPLRAEFERAAAAADAVILAMGEQPYAEGEGNIGDLTLPAPQLEWIAAAGRASSRCVLVLIEGRPRVVTAAVGGIPAILFAGLPGFEGATAIAEVLSGRTNPSGKLPISYPEFPTHFVPYNHKPTDSPTALFPFGHGLGYSRFAYSDLRLSAPGLDAAGRLQAQVTVANQGSRPGKEAVLWFLTDEVGSVTRPVRALKHYEKALIEAGASRTFRFEIVPERDLSFPDAAGARRLEPGRFVLSVGGLQQAFELRE